MSRTSAALPPELDLASSRQRVDEIAQALLRRRRRRALGLVFGFTAIVVLGAVVVVTRQSGEEAVTASEQPRSTSYSCGETADPYLLPGVMVSLRLAEPVAKLRSPDDWVDQGSKGTVTITNTGPGSLQVSSNGALQGLYLSSEGAVVSSSSGSVAMAVVTNIRSGESADFTFVAPAIACEGEIVPSPTSIAVAFLASRDGGPAQFLTSDPVKFG